MGRALLAQLRHHSHTWLHHRAIFDLPPDFRIRIPFARYGPGRVCLHYSCPGLERVTECSPQHSYWFLPVGNLDNTAVRLLVLSQEAGRLPFGWLTMMVILLIVVPLVVGQVLQKSSPSTRPSWLVVGQAIHRDLHRRGANGRIQVTSDQVMGCDTGRCNSYPDLVRLGGWLADGWPGN